MTHAQQPAAGVPSISVVIPCHNSSATLERALKSVYEQSLAPLEVILVDDGSTPYEASLLDIVASDSHQTPMRVVRTPKNEGPASARNVGWEAAHGDWIAFLDSDDAWHPQKLELQLAAADAPSAMISTQSLVLVDGERPERVAYSSRESQKLTLMNYLVRNRSSTSSVIVRRNISHRFSEGRWATEDYELWMRIAASAEVTQVKHPLTYSFKVRVGAGGLSGRVWSMIRGEYETFAILRRDGVLNRRQLFLGIAILTIRTMRRVVILAARRVMNGLRR